MTTIYRTYAPSGDVDHATPLARDEYILEFGADVVRVSKLYYNGHITWNDEETRVIGTPEMAEDCTEDTATCLMAIWCGEDTMLDENPHELVYEYFEVDQMGQERRAEIAELSGRASCGGV